jgi:hypothetical protein
MEKRYGTKGKLEKDTMMPKGLNKNNIEAILTPSSIDRRLGDGASDKIMFRKVLSELRNKVIEIGKDEEKA